MLEKHICRHNFFLPPENFLLFAEIKKKSSAEQEANWHTTKKNIDFSLNLCGL